MLDFVLAFFSKTSRTIGILFLDLPYCLRVSMHSCCWIGLYLKGKAKMFALGLVLASFRFTHFLLEFHPSEANRLVFSYDCTR